MIKTFFFSFDIDYYFHIQPMNFVIDNMWVASKQNHINHKLGNYFFSLNHQCVIYILSQSNGVIQGNRDNYQFCQIHIYLDCNNFVFLLIFNCIFDFLQALEKNKILNFITETLPEAEVSLMWDGVYRWCVCLVGGGGGMGVRSECLWGREAIQEY